MRGRRNLEAAPYQFVGANCTHSLQAAAGPSTDREVIAVGAVLPGGSGFVVGSRGCLSRWASRGGRRRNDDGGNGISIGTFPVLAAPVADSLGIIGQRGVAQGKSGIGTMGVGVSLKIRSIQRLLARIGRLPVIRAACRSDGGLGCHYGNQSRGCTNQTYQEITTSHTFSHKQTARGCGRRLDGEPRPRPPIRAMRRSSLFLFPRLLTEAPSGYGAFRSAVVVLNPESRGSLHCAWAPPVQVRSISRNPWSRLPCKRSVPEEEMVEQQGCCGCR